MIELRADAASAAGTPSCPATARARSRSSQADAAAAAEQKRQRRYLVRALLRSPTFMIGLIIVLFWVFMAAVLDVHHAEPHAQRRR